MAKKILVVDDEKPISDIVKYNLENEGYEVITAFDGQEALDKVDEDDPDLILLDFMLPVIDGLEVARTIRKTKDTPITITLKAYAKENPEKVVVYRKAVFIYPRADQLK